MKSKLTLVVLAITVLGLAPSLHGVCTNATMVANWGFTGTGTIFSANGPVPVAAVGTVRFDLNGNVFGGQDRSVGGGELHETISGTYSITRDCQLTVVASVYDDSGTLQRTTTLKGVVVKGGKKTRMIYQSITLPNGAPLPSVLILDADKT